VLKNICVFGASSNVLEQGYKDEARLLGNLLAEHGLGVVFGGGRTGLMGAVAAGAKERGGRVTGVIPEKLNLPGIAYEFCDELIVTHTMHERKSTMERLAQGFVVLPGGIGTIEELFEVLSLKQLEYLDAPVAVLNQGGFFDDLFAQLSRCACNGFMHEAYLNLCFGAKDARAAVEYLLSYRPERLPDKLWEVLKK